MVMQFSSSSSHRKGFTLVEILIVVVILGILAAIVVPKFSTAGDDARNSNLATQLRTIRNQLEAYRIEHNNNYPLAVNMWDALTRKSDYNGVIDPTARFGPYMNKPPTNPFTQSFLIAAPGAGTLAHGWEYNEANGTIFAVGYDELTHTYTPPGGGGGDGGGGGP